MERILIIYALLAASGFCISMHITRDWWFGDSGKVALAVRCLIALACGLLWFLFLPTALVGWLVAKRNEAREDREYLAWERKQKGLN